MALAWNAGWVNSPQGFKSPILRTGPRCDQADEPGRARLRERPTDSRRSMRRWIAVLWHASFFVIAGGSLLLLRPAPLVRAHRRWLRTASAWRCASWRRADRPGRAARRVHAAAHPQARVRHPTAGVCRCGPGRSSCTCWPGRSSSAPRSARSGSAWTPQDNICSGFTVLRPPSPSSGLSLLPGVRRRTAAATAETDQGEETQTRSRSPPQEARRRRRRGVARRDGRDGRGHRRA